MKPVSRHLPLAAAVLLSSATAHAQLVATPQKKDGVYAAGETVAWTVEARKPDAKAPPAAAVKEAGYVVKRDGLTPIKEGVLDLSSGSAKVEASLDQPGALLLELRPKGGDKAARTHAGVLVDPDKLQPASPRPADFDAFWAAKLDALAAVPVNPKVEPADAKVPGVDYFKVTLDNVGGTRVHGQLARPKGDGKRPALLVVQWAGVYGLKPEWVTTRAKQGWLALNIEAHDLPFDRPDDFYKTAAETTLKDYMAIGNTDRDTSYFLRMYLGCHRAAEYLTTRPDWDGTTLVVIGTSQGGQQAFAAAGLHPKVTAMLANVPAGCDVTGPRAGRAAGFPYWADRARSSKNDKILEVGRYFDAANFAARVKGPALVAMGLIDETCPPAGVYAALNQVPGRREAVVLVNSDHHGRGNAQAAFYGRSEAWLRALAKGEPPPAE